MVIVMYKLYHSMAIFFIFDYFMGIQQIDPWFSCLVYLFIKERKKKVSLPYLGSCVSTRLGLARHNIIYIIKYIQRDKKEKNTLRQSFR